MNPRCSWRGCRSREIELTYLGRPLCRTHWLRLCQWQEKGRDAEARAQIGLRPRASATTNRRNNRLKGTTSMRQSKSRRRGDSDSGGILVLGMMAALLILMFMWLGIDCDDLACCCAAPFLF